MTARIETGGLIGKIEKQIPQDTGRGALPFGLHGEDLFHFVRPDRTHTNGARTVISGEKAYQGGPSAADRMDL
ncbi:MAG: hypothetical protein COU25_03125 [Candidatus Levybacteria bacterium CG10_big_fil_rev_8_21_14_0_10_35_13]|nr:MAG: hypothetical protein COU25_03125 [Candidatus Levybacteria bacterium CG10_big_fil_rev_8_21_14_0_10_35_13]